MAEFTNIADLIARVGSGITEVKLCLPDAIKNDPILRKVQIDLLADFLKTNPPLISLDLSNSKLDLENGIAIAEALTTNNALRELNINNNIDTIGGTAIGQALKHNTSLRKLSIKRNNLGAEGGTAIGEALSSNSSLKVLNISYNKLGVAGGTAIGLALADNVALSDLNINNNQLTSLTG